MHFGTFQLADEGQDDPVDDLRAALKRVELGGSTFRVLAHGEALDVPRHHDAPAGGEPTAGAICAPVPAAGSCSPM